MIIGDAERKVMNILWDNEGVLMEAKQVSQIAAELFGWNKNTTYTLLKRCIEKGAIERQEPNFICYPKITKQEIQKEEVERLIEKVFDGSKEQLLILLLEKEGISSDKIEVLLPLIDKLKN